MTIVDEYTFTETARHVQKAVESQVKFRNKLIIEHDDSCDARAWAAAPLGSVAGSWAEGIRFSARMEGKCHVVDIITTKAERRQFHVPEQEPL